MKRIILFLLTNILVIATISIVTSLLGIDRYLSEQGINYEMLFLFCLVWGMGGSFISLLMSKWIAKRAMGVQVIDPLMPGQFRPLVDRVHFLAKKVGIEKMPEVGVYESSEVNAFATGSSKNNSLVAVSTGLLQRMEEGQVDGVLAHEVAHVANGDMVTMALVQGVINAFVMFFARVATFAINNALKDDRGRGGLGPFAHFMSIMVLQALFSVMAMPLIAWFSRYREFRADSDGAKLAGKEKMIGALEALKRYSDTLQSGTDRAIQTFQINSKRSRVAALLSTHPPLEDRITALK